MHSRTFTRLKAIASVLRRLTALCLGLSKSPRAFVSIDGRVIVVEPLFKKSA